MINRLISWLASRFARRFGALQEPWYGIVNTLARQVVLIANPERVRHLGALHPGKTIYVIRDFPDFTGIAGWYDRVLGYLQHAESRGWTPVVLPPQTPDAQFGNWYTYFSLISEIPPTDVMSSRNVVFASMLPTIYKRFNRGEIARRKRLSEKAGFNDETYRFVKNRAQGVIDSGDIVVGSYYRGTDYRVLENWRPVGHATVPEVDAFCERIETDFRHWNLPMDEGAHLFVVTEEQEALEAIRLRFPRCRYVRKERFSHFDGQRPICQSKLLNTSGIDNNRLYLLDLYLLSRCDYLIGTLVGGVLMALNWNGNAYKGVDIINLGVS